MPISFEAAQNEILALLRATDIPNVFDGVVPTGFKLPVQNNAHLPYICVSFGGKSPVAMRSQGIDGSRNDIKRTTVAVECVGDSPADVRKVCEIVRDVLEGYIVDVSWGELSETLAGDYTMYKPEYTLWPIRFAVGIHYSALVNATT